jgi:hypothetical protein
MRGRCNVHRRLATASDANRALIHAGPCLVHAFYIANANTSSYKHFLKLFDTAALPSLGIDIPKIVGLAELIGTVTSTKYVPFPGGILFSLGLAMAVVKNQADSTTGLIDQANNPLSQANEAVYHVFYEVL